ncbi:TetR family transcriptional regulator [Nonomuraea sp. NPDC046570]|uniref:TetR/AcrR family transcriptional regulator n=1 Tax=Nonomuraea sp. NPDC046570 TaxID=3155255 RepID=UPI0033FAB32D
MDEGRHRDREGTCLRILEAARRLFAELGYDQVTMRLLAAEAGVNVALINRYFGSKHELFAKVLAQQGSFPGVLGGGEEEGLPRLLAEYVADRLRSAAGSPVVATIARSSSSPEVHEIMRERIRGAIMGPLQARLTGSDDTDTRLRAAVATALIVGVAQLRNVFGPMDDLPREAVVERLTEVFTACLR